HVLAISSQLLAYVLTSSREILNPVILSGTLAHDDDVKSKDPEVVNAAKGAARHSQLPVIAWPANAIPAPQCSARSAQRGFTASMSAIFFDRRQPFNCFSRLMAL